MVPKKNHQNKYFHLPCAVLAFLSRAPMQQHVTFSTPLSWSRGTVRLGFLRAVAAFAEGAALTSRASTTPEQETVAAALSRVHFSVLGGRAGYPRSCDSVFAGAVTRFLGGSLRAEQARVIPIGEHTAFAVTWDRRHVVAAHNSVAGVHLRVYGMRNRTLRHITRHGLPESCVVKSVTAGPDGRLYVVDRKNAKVHVLSAAFERVGYVHSGVFYGRVIVNAQHLVSQCFGMNTWGRYYPLELAIFEFTDSVTSDAVTRLKTCYFCGDAADALCLLPDDKAFAATFHCYVRIFTFDGEMRAKVPLGHDPPAATACSAFGELVVLCEDTCTLLRGVAVCDVAVLPGDAIVIVPSPRPAVFALCLHFILSRQHDARMAAIGRCKHSVAVNRDADCLKISTRYRVKRLVVGTPHNNFTIAGDDKLAVSRSATRDADGIFRFTHVAHERAVHRKHRDATVVAVGKGDVSVSREETQPKRHIHFAIVAAR
jgi:hypothetical protein